MKACLFEYIRSAVRVISMLSALHIGYRFTTIIFGLLPTSPSFYYYFLNSKLSGIF